MLYVLYVHTHTHVYIKPASCTVISDIQRRQRVHMSFCLRRTADDDCRGFLSAGCQMDCGGLRTWCCHLYCGGLSSVQCCGCQEFSECWCCLKTDRWSPCDVQLMLIWRRWVKHHHWWWNTRHASSSTFRYFIQLYSGLFLLFESTCCSM